MTTLPGRQSAARPDPPNSDSEKRFPVMTYEAVIGWTRRNLPARPSWQGFYDWYLRPVMVPRAVNVLPAF